MRGFGEFAMKHLYRTGLLISTVVLLALIGCETAVITPDPDPDPDPPPPVVLDLAYGKRWWTVLNGEQREAALYGTAATAEQARAAQKEYGALDSETKKKVNAAAREIYGEGGHESVGAWWETLDCRQKRIAVGEGNTDDPTSRYCAHYPGAVS